MAFPAKFPGHCAACHEQIAVGQEIEFIPGGGKSVRHVTCRHLPVVQGPLDYAKAAANLPRSILARLAAQAIRRQVPDEPLLPFLDRAAAGEEFADVPPAETGIGDWARNVILSDSPARAMGHLVEKLSAVAVGTSGDASRMDAVWRDAVTDLAAHLG